MRAEGVSPEWVSGAEASRRLGCAPKQVPKLACKGFLSVRRLPGCDPRYLLSDVERLAARATRPAANESAPAGQTAERVDKREGASHERG